MHFFISNKENRSSDHYTVDMYNSAVHYVLPVLTERKFQISLMVQL